MSIIENQIQEKLSLFSNTQQSYVRDLMSYSANLDKTETYIILKIIRSIDDSTSDSTKKYFIDLLEDIHIKEENPPIHIADKGENVKVDIKLRPSDNFTNSMLIAREAETKQALSSDELQGTDAEIQTIVLDDIDLEVESFTKVFLLAETEDTNTTPVSASGDVETVISKMYLFIDEDSEASN